MNIVYHKSFVPVTKWGEEITPAGPRYEISKYRSALRVSLNGQDVMASVETSPSDFYRMTASERDWREAMNFDVMRGQIMHLIEEKIFGKRGDKPNDR